MRVVKRSHPAGQTAAAVTGPPCGVAAHRIGPPLLAVSLLAVSIATGRLSPERWSPCSLRPVSVAGADLGKTLIELAFALGRADIDLILT